jgi:hypothetical protein
VEAEVLHKLVVSLVMETKAKMVDLELLLLVMQEHREQPVAQLHLPAEIQSTRLHRLVYFIQDLLKQAADLSTKTKHIGITHS